MRQEDAGVAGVLGVLGENEVVFGVVVGHRSRGLPRLLSNKEAREDFFDNEPVLLRLGRASSGLSVPRRACCEEERTRDLIAFMPGPHAISGDAGLQGGVGRAVTVFARSEEMDSFAME